jgi:hypothetical protein
MEKKKKKGSKICASDKKLWWWEEEERRGRGGCEEGVEKCYDLLINLAASFLYASDLSLILLLLPFPNFNLPLVIFLLFRLIRKELFVGGG